MRIQYLGAVAIASMLTLGGVACSAQTAVDPCAAVKETVADPCAGANPCAATDPCAGANPCATADPCAGANPCAAADPCAAASEAMAQPYAYSFEGVAIRGADPVAYFTAADAVKGSAEYAYEWQGATWWFSSAENRDLFASDPEAYAPQYGGYCAKAVSEGNLASIDPEAWKIVDGKLYLNYSPDVQGQWLQDVEGNITKGDQNWDGVLNNDVVHESGQNWQG
jgi:YHS domain-containing protein